MTTVKIGAREVIVPSKDIAIVGGCLTLMIGSIAIAIGIRKSKR